MADRPQPAAQQHEVECRIRAARDLLTNVLDKRATIADVGDGAIALVSRAMAIADGDWETFTSQAAGGDE